MNDVMREIYENIVKYGMACSVTPAEGDEPYVLSISVGFDGSASKYMLLPDGPVRLFIRKTGCIRTVPINKA
jgi:hypothetical protein